MDATTLKRRINDQTTSGEMLKLAILNIARAYELESRMRRAGAPGTDPRDMFESWLSGGLEDAGFPVSAEWYAREVQAKGPAGSGT